MSGLPISVKPYCCCDKRGYFAGINEVQPSDDVCKKVINRIIEVIDSMGKKVITIAKVLH